MYTHDVFQFFRILVYLNLSFSLVVTFWDQEMFQKIERLSWMFGVGNRQMSCPTMWMCVEYSNRLFPYWEKIMYLEMCNGFIACSLTSRNIPMEFPVPGWVHTSSLHSYRKCVFVGLLGLSPGVKKLFDTMQLRHIVPRLVGDAQLLDRSLDLWITISRTSWDSEKFM